MKTVQDKDGNKIEVKDDTPCQAGINGALPIMLDKTLDAGIFAEMAESEAGYKADAPKRAKQKTKKDIVALEEQITSRRLRDAILGKDGGWLVKQDIRIEAERAKLNGS